MKVQDRFLKYVAFDTQSDSTSNTTPSTLKQLKLAQYLVSEMNLVSYMEIFHLTWIRNVLTLDLLLIWIRQKI